MPMTDDELREALAPLGGYEPTESELATVLADAQARDSRRAIRRRRLLLGFAVATGVAAVLLTVLPASPTDQRGSQAASPVDLLRTAAAVAADQPEPPPFTGYRYTEVIEHWRYEPILVHGQMHGRVQEIEQRVEYWVDRKWEGRRVSHRGRVIEGRVSPSDYFVKPSSGPYHYGDAPRAYPARLPAEPGALRAAILRSLHTEDWVPDPRNESMKDYHVLRRTLLLLKSANTTPELRAGLWGVLAQMPGVRAAPDAEDPLGRDGEAVEIVSPAGPGVFTVMFDPETAEMLFWDLRGVSGGEPNQTHTVVRAAHVAKAGERP
jgi:hypothetical protein